MKKLLLLLLPALSFAQEPIQHYLGYYNEAICNSFSDWDGTCSRSYLQAGNAGDYNHQGTGEQTWTFNGLQPFGGVVYSNSLPNEDDLNEFPGTTRIVTDSYYDGDGILIDESRSLLSDGPTTIRGLQGAGISFNYTNPAEIGNFPMSYGFSNTDDFEGTFEFEGTTGTFSGDIVSTYDAYGTVVTDDGTVGTFEASRLKIVETINLEISGLGNVGTIVQTRYIYFGNLPAMPAIVAYETFADLPLLGINETSYELHYTNPSAVLANPQPQKQVVSVWPNPTSGQINLNLEGRTMSGYSIVDVNGRVVASAQGQHETLDISALARGFYLLNISTELGSSAIKIIKE